MKKSLIMFLVLAFVLCIAGTAFAGPFADVPANSWVYNAVNQLAKAGIVEGYGDGTFRGDKEMTRYEMAIVVAKAMERSDKADAANKALIEKLATEFAQELNTLGVRVATLETKVSDLEKIKFSGDFRLQNRTIENKVVSPDGFKQGSWDQLRIRLNFTYQIDDNTTLFTRFADRNDFGVQDTATYAYGDNSVMDQYGVKITDGDWTYKFGRQDAKLGQGGIIGVGSDAPAIESKFDGMVLAGKSGDATFHFIAGKEEGYYWGDQVGYDYIGPSEWYGADYTTKVGKDLSLGVAAAESKYDTNSHSYASEYSSYPATGYLPSTKYYAANVSYNITPTVNFYGEYVKSSANTQNWAYDAGLYFSLPKGYVGLQYNNVEPNGCDPYLSGIGDQYFMYWGNGFEQGYKCVELYFGYPLTKTATFELVANSITSPVFSGQDKELVTDVKWSF